MTKAKQQQQYQNEAERLARRDADKVDIETTAEGKSFLRGRYNYYLKRLKGGEGR